MSVVTKDNNKGLDIFSVGMLASAYMALQFLVMPLSGAISSDGAMLNEAFFLSLGGVLLFFAGFMLTGVLGSAGKQKSIGERNTAVTWGAKRVAIVIAALIVGGLAAKLRHCVWGVGGGSCLSLLGRNAFSPNLLHLLALNVLLCHLMLVRREQGALGSSARWLGFGAVAGLIVWSLYLGEGRYFLMSILLSYMTIEWYLGGRQGRRWLVIVGSAALIIFLIKSWIKFGTMPAYVLAQMGPGEFINSSIMGRMAQNHVFDAIVTKWDGSSLNFAAWPDFLNQLLGRQLQYLDGNDFGKAFSILGINDMVTGVGPTFMGDFYINAGFAGVLAGMFVVGVIYRFAYMAVPFVGGQCGVLIYASMLPSLVHGVEDWFFLSLARVVSIAALCIGLCVLLRTKGSRSNGHETIKAVN